jgi:hypothetical protein
MIAQRHRVIAKGPLCTDKYLQIYVLEGKILDLQTSFRTPVNLESLDPPRNQPSKSKASHNLYTKVSTVTWMDSPIVSRLFRQLFTHRSCQSVRSHSSLPFRIQHARRPAQIRSLSSRGEGAEESNWQQRTDMWPLDMTKEYQKFPMVTADQLRSRRERPTRIKMLTRDFIEGRMLLTPRSLS